MKKVWIDFCKDFGQRFLIGKGPASRGIFNRFLCFPAGVKAGPVRNNPPNLWMFTFVEGTAGLQLKAMLQSEDFNLFTLELPTLLNFETMFSSPEALEYLTMATYQRLPIAWQVSLSADGKHWLLPSGVKSSELLFESDNELMLYQLQFDSKEKLWIPKLFGKALGKLAPEHSEPDEEGSHKISIDQFHRPGVDHPAVLWAQELYELEPGRAGKGSLYLVEVKKTDRTREEGAGTENDNEAILTYLLPIPARSENGEEPLRIGLELKLLSDSKSDLRITTERSIPLSQQNLLNYRFQWSRAQVGYSFKLNPDLNLQQFKPHFRLTPRIGILSIDAYLPVALQDQVESANFDLKVQNQFEFGGEMALELWRKPYRIAAFASNHLAGYLIKGRDSAKVSNQRFGGSLHYRHQLETWKMAVGLDALAYFDWITLKKNLVPVGSTTLAPSDVAASGISKNSVYLGLGSTLSW
ncbi:MAG: hypothetical protein H7318_12040 [Oligoflexus sp.]|nr:hypothetical protein [Oligoflexus sp.]